MTDWGARPLGAASLLFDPLHYNNGAVWPFVTGWVALAQYRYHNAPAGWFALQAIARTGFDHALGRNPELFSGRLHKPLDTAVPQQFFATSMVLTPLLRGLLGIDIDVPARRVRIAPHLPPEWDSVAVDNLPVAGERWSVVIRRSPGRVAATIQRPAGATVPFEVSFAPALPLGARLTGAGATLESTLGDMHASAAARVDRAAELRVEYEGGWRLLPPVMPPAVGSRSDAPRILSERLIEGAGYEVVLEGRAGRRYDFRIRAPSPAAARSLRAAAGAGGSAALAADLGQGERGVLIRFPATGGNSDDYTGLTVVFR
jgi:hypothetical protein